MPLTREQRSAYNRAYRQRNLERLRGMDRRYIDEGAVNKVFQAQFRAKREAAEQRRQERAQRLRELGESLRKQIEELLKKPFSWQGDR